MSPRRILVIGHGSKTSRVVASMLRTQGYEVCVSPDVPTGLDFAENDHPDLILLDLTTGLSGGRLVSEIQRLRGLQETPLVVLTVRPYFPPDPRIAAALLAPIEAGELFAIARALLDEPDDPPDPSSGEGVEVPLAASEPRARVTGRR